MLQNFPALTYVSASEKSFEKRNKSSSALDLRPKVTKLEPLKNLKKSESFQTLKATTLDEKVRKILESVEEKDKAKNQYPEEHCKEVQAFPHHWKEKDNATESIIQSKKEDDNLAYLNSLNEHFEKFEKVNDCEEEENKPELMALEKLKMEGTNPSETPSTNGQEATIKKFENSKTPQLSIAKRYHEENLRHKPLPDVIDDPVYRAFLNGRHSHPEELVHLEGMPSAIGWKSYSVPGPTECSKLKVYRPKTALEKTQLPREDRPKTSGCKDKCKKKWLPIDLAICWDLKPDDPSEEPKRSPHIDGSNGSAAPAVFTMIHPRETAEEKAEISASCQAVAERITKGIEDDNLANLPSQAKGKTVSPSLSNPNKEAIMACVKSSPKPKSSQSQSPVSANSLSTSAAEFARSNPKTAWSNEDTSKALSNKLLNLQKANSRQEKTNNQWNTFRIQNHNQRSHHQSTPNLTSACDNSPMAAIKSNSKSPLKISNGNRECSSAAPTPNKDEKSKSQKAAQKGRNCSACEKPGAEDNRERQEPFKAAFKAGVPKSGSSNSGSISAGKSYKVPKMRLPYAKKNYSIGTLVPPFSFWAESNGQEYPEHWRLASVYQHSFKPLNSRKRPMLYSVYQ